jgi:hypothetical protein
MFSMLNSRELEIYFNIIIIETINNIVNIFLFKKKE